MAHDTDQPKRDRTALTPQLNLVYRWTSCLWTLYAASLGGFAYGSVLLAQTPVRLVMPVLAGLVVAAMLLRLLIPGRPEWTRWSLPLIGGLSVSTALFAVFGIEGLGFTVARVAAVGLTLVPGVMAYTHWIGESVVTAR